MTPSHFAIWTECLIGAAGVSSVLSVHPADVLQVAGVPTFQPLCPDQQRRQPGPQRPGPKG